MRPLLLIAVSDLGLLKDDFKGSTNVHELQLRV